MDVMFVGGVSLRLLLQCNFAMQWNTKPHGLADDQLRETICRFVRDGIMDQRKDSLSQELYSLTPKGGDLWSKERCPIWDRYSVDMYRTTSQGRRLIVILAVSPSIRDDALRILPPHWARRRAAMIKNYDLISWHPFEHVHVGVAIHQKLTQEDGEIEELKQGSRVLRDRSWWSSVDELQTFLNSPTIQRPY